MPESLVEKLSTQMADLTREKVLSVGIENARRNLPLMQRGKPLNALLGETLGEDDSAIVIAAGPSIKRRDPGKLIRERGYRGAIIATESATRYCLSSGVVPHLVVTVDPRPRIVRWLGDKKLTKEHIIADKYYGRQDLDSFFADELKANAEVIKLVDRFGPSMRIAMSTSSSPELVQRAMDAGMTVYWWNPMYDDPDLPGSVTAELQRENGMPSVNAGGNVGTACWMMADAVLGKRHVAVTGIDFSYYEDTPIGITQYYQEILELVGKENMDDLYVRIFNPHDNKWFFTDPAYFWFRQVFLEMVGDADCRTYNCTEGGILFGDGIEYTTLASFLDARGGAGPA